MKKIRFLLLFPLLVLASGCLMVRYNQTSDRLEQTEKTRITAFGLFKDTSLEAAVGATKIDVTETNGASYSSARNLGATNVSTVVSTNSAAVINAGGSAVGNVIGAAVKP